MASNGTVTQIKIMDENGQQKIYDIQDANATEKLKGVYSSDIITSRYSAGADLSGDRSVSGIGYSWGCLRWIRITFYLANGTVNENILWRSVCALIAKYKASYMTYLYPYVNTGASTYNHQSRITTDSASKIEFGIVHDISTAPWACVSGVYIASF